MAGASSRETTVAIGRSEVAVQTTSSLQLLTEQKKPRQTPKNDASFNTSVTTGCLRWCHELKGLTAVRKSTGFLSAVRRALKKSGKFKYKKKLTLH